MKIKINKTNYESVSLRCGIVEDYFDIIEQVQETEQEGKIMSKTQRTMIKEFLVKVFGSKFTTDDIDEHLDFADLMVYFMSIGAEINEKTESKLKKLAKK